MESTTLINGLNIYFILLFNFEVAVGETIWVQSTFICSGDVNTNVLTCQSGGFLLLRSTTFRKYFKDFISICGRSCRCQPCEALDEKDYDKEFKVEYICAEESSIHLLSGLTSTPDAHGFVVSPRYPNKYPNQLSASLTIGRRRGTLVNIIIHHHFIEDHPPDCTDYLLLRDINRDVQMWPDICGVETFPHNNRNLFGRYITVSFVTSDERSDLGFLLEFSVTNESSSGPDPNLPTTTLTVSNESSSGFDPDLPLTTVTAMTTLNRSGEPDHDHVITAISVCTVIIVFSAFIHVVVYFWICKERMFTNQGKSPEIRVNDQISINNPSYSRNDDSYMVIPGDYSPPCRGLENTLIVKNPRLIYGPTDVTNIYDTVNTDDVKSLTQLAVNVEPEQERKYSLARQCNFSDDDVLEYPARQNSDVPRDCMIENDIYDSTEIISSA